MAVSELLKRNQTCHRVANEQNSFLMEDRSLAETPLSQP
jgi:hypothetical protein